MAQTTVPNSEIQKKFEEFPTCRAWKKTGLQKRFGVLMPLGQIRTTRNQGVGDFADLEVFADLCRRMGCSIIQILPINDMGRGKTPYSSLSAFALDPIYIALDRVPGMEKGNRSQDMEKFLKDNEELVFNLRTKERIDFDNIRKYKLDALKAAFDDFRKEADGEALGSLEEFKQRNSYWLPDYCLFRALKEANDWKPWEEWPKGTKDRSKTSLSQLFKKHAEEIEFLTFVQWLAFSQMTEVHRKLSQQGILLKGDIPLLVDYESADVWAHPEFFNREVCAGAPPDQYSIMGQNWGMPTYNWQNHAQDDFNWWRDRLKYAENFYDIFRIDHVVGLFRIWTIPITEEFPRGKKSGKNGYFDPQDPGQPPVKPIWEKQGKTLLEMIVGATEMLPIGEDLGVIPYVCRRTLKDMGIPGYKVIIWERDWGNKKEDSPFIPTEEYPYISMSTSTTHDFWTLPGWWIHRDSDEEKAKAEDESKEALWTYLTGEKKRPERYTQKLHDLIMKKLFHSNSVFLIMPFYDIWGTAYGLMGEYPLDERINDPDNPEKPENWSGKMPLEMENFPKHPSILNKIDQIRTLAQESGRMP